MFHHVERVRANAPNGGRAISTLSAAATLKTTVRKLSSSVLPRVKAQTARHARKRNVAVRTATEAAPEAQIEDTSETFNWFKHWWPVQLIYNLDTDKPNRIQLLEEYFVVWKSKNGEWVAMRDMCPHRLAPLSEGRIEEDGTLMCSYHGWRFDERGQCVKIPQADDEKAHSAACNSSRSCAMTHPCKIRGGVVWIWPDHSETRFIDASVSDIGLPDEYSDRLEEQVQEGYSVGFTATVPYEYDVLMENVIDPSHVPFSHHGTSSEVQRSNGGPLIMRVDDSDDADYIARVAYKRRDGLEVVLAVRDCSSLFYITKIPSKKEARVLVLLTCPIAMGYSRLFLANVPPRKQSKEKRRPSLFQRFVRWCPWYIHLNLLTILDGDTVFLHTQSHYLRDMTREDNRRKRYFMPASSDLAVMLFRKWLDSKGNGGPFSHLESQTRRLLPRRQLLDRYRNHVSECKVCQSALRAVNGMISFCKVASRGCLFLTGALVLHGMQHGALVARWRIAAAFAASIALFALQKFLKRKVLPQFHFVDYIHAEKN